MTHEPQPLNRENVADISLSQIIATQIANLGDQNHLEPDSSEKQFGRSIEADFDYRYGRHGSLDFGSKWNVHRMNVGARELILVAKARGVDQEPQGEFYIHEFSETGQLTRTWFSETDSGEIWKQRQTTFGTGVGGRFVELARPLSIEEVEVLKETIADPASHRVELTNLVTLNDQESADIVQANKENRRGAQQLQDNLRAYETSRRLGWAAARNDTTLY